MGGGASEQIMLSGRCLCGQVAYEIDGQLRHITHCHCGMCRRAHGAAFATYAVVAKRRFRLVRSDTLRAFRSSDHATRSFCRECGSPLFFAEDHHPEAISVALGTLEGDPGGRPVAHIHTASRASWVDIADSLPQWPGDLPESPATKA
jgi:hypothetical protein